MKVWNTVTGVAGSGKTSFAMDLMERKLREGLKWYEIGFASFSRAACAEGAARAAKITGIDETRLQKDGWFRTLHSCALRATGLSPSIILDHESKDGKEWMSENNLGERGGQPGSHGDFVAAALNWWDKQRSHLVPRWCTDVNRSEAGHTAEMCVSREKPCVFCGETLTDDTRATLGHTEGVVCHHLNSLLRSDLRELMTHNSISIGNIFSNSPEVQLAQECVIRHEPNLNPYRVKSLVRDTRHPECVTMCHQDTVEICSKCLHSQEFRDVTHSLPEILVKLSVSSGEARWGIWEDSNWKLEDIQAYIQVYERSKRLWGKRDFSDLLLQMAGVKVDESTLKFYKSDAERGISPEEVKVWIIDEYQDCSMLLDQAAQVLTEAADEVWALGDGYQAIYGFSGSQAGCYAIREYNAKIRGRGLLLNRTWRNPEPVVEWSEEVVEGVPGFERRGVIAEGDVGSVGLMEWGKFLSLLPLLARTDTLILGRSWWNVMKVKERLDELCIPWRSCQEKQSSRWEAPAKIAVVLVLRGLVEGNLISEHDWRRITDHFPQKVDGEELFVRGTKAKWKKLECSHVPKTGLGGLSEWGATDYFAHFVRSGIWKHDSLLLLDTAMNEYGIDVVRNPGIRIGSIHSVKGLEADNVFCMADSTQKCLTADEYEETCLKYVAITRARRNYRLVVDQVSYARNNPQFWAAPSKYWSFPDEGIGCTEKDQEVFGTPRSTGLEEPGEHFRTEGSPGPDCDPQRSDLLRGDQDREGSDLKNAGEDAAGDLEPWWKF